MLIFYEQDHLRNRQETLLRDVEGQILYRGIYDFSYKYRTRVFDPQGREAGYVELDITSVPTQVDLQGPDGNRIASLIRKEGLYLEPEHLTVEKDHDGFFISGLMKAENGKMEVPDEDPLKYVLLLFAMIEIERKK